MESIRIWVENSPYTRTLGARLDAVETDSDQTTARILLPFRDENSNPGGALHGGCAASLAAVGGQCVARAAMGEETGPWHTASVQVNYLAAAIGEDVTANARLLRRGKDMCFVEIEVSTLTGKAIAHATAMVRARHGAEPSDRYPVAGDDGGTDPGPMGPHVSKTPYMSEREMLIEHMTESHSRIVLPFVDANADLDEGIHEGAILALLDTTGAMASWAETGPGAFKASTPSLQAQILCPSPKQDLIAYGKVIQRDGAIFWADAVVAGANDGFAVARGTVIYRIVT
ncbi:MAG TPA: PaaI family thioesterase [Myxococcales bacterium]|jgi:uncharacterized protein (TIGR00369 family)|nr:PaaI family thioesterase [Myxococcales bacterium]HIL02667.1 PaaI family thioesterase [Myxococcales bacterium]